MALNEIGDQLLACPAFPSISTGAWLVEIVPICLKIFWMHGARPTKGFNSRPAAETALSRPRDFWTSWSSPP